MDKGNRISNIEHNIFAMSTSMNINYINEYQQYLINIGRHISFQVPQNLLQYRQCISVLMNDETLA